MVSLADYGPRGPWFGTWPDRRRCDLVQVTFYPVKPREPWTYDCLEQTVTRLETTVKSKGPSFQT